MEKYASCPLFDHDCSEAKSKQKYSVTLNKEDRDKIYEQIDLNRNFIQNNYATIIDFFFNYSKLLLTSQTTSSVKTF